MEFTRNQWKNFRADFPLVIDSKELRTLQSQYEPLNLEEVNEIYLPLSRLLNLHIKATQNLYQVGSSFLGSSVPRVPFVIGIVGSVAVGKSTTARLIQSLLRKLTDNKVALITTDGYLFSNKKLKSRNLLQRKGFPESYNLNSLMRLMIDIKAGNFPLQTPVYSHLHYDIIPNKLDTIEKADIIILEGLNLLQIGKNKSPPEVESSLSVQKQVFISDFIDLSIYVDAEINVIREWYIQRFLRLHEQAKDNKDAYLYQFRELNNLEARLMAEKIWLEINQINLEKNILPFRERANIILHKNGDHYVDKVLLRKL